MGFQVGERVPGGRMMCQVGECSTRWVNEVLGEWSARWVSEVPGG